MNENYLKSVNEFIAQDVIAIAGYSSKKEHTSHFLYEKFEKNGNKVYAINPNHQEIKGKTCYQNLQSVPDPIGGVMIVTAPDKALSIVKECKELGIKKVWMHRALGSGSFSEDAVVFCKENGINCITGGCPAMFISADPFHRVFKHISNWAGKMKTEDAW